MIEIRGISARVLLCIFSVVLLSSCTDIKQSSEVTNPTNRNSLSNNKAGYPSGPTLAVVGDAEVVGITVTGEVVSVLCRWPSEYISRVVEIRQSGNPDPDWAGYQAEIYAGFQLGFGIDFSRPLDPEDETSYRVEEWTATDFLGWTSVDLPSGDSFETYDYNGTVMSFTNSKSATPQVVSPSDFPAFYPGSSLENVPNGDKLIALIDDTYFWNVLQNELIAQNIIPTTDKITWGTVGAGSSLAAAAKCLLGGGLINPLCIAATGVSLAVAAAHLLCKIPWINCPEGV